MKELTKEEIIEQHRDLQEFKYGGTDSFYRNSNLRNYLNRKLGASIKVVFSTSKDYNFKNGLDWSGDTIIIINHKDEFIEMTNSEWAIK